MLGVRKLYCVLQTDVDMVCYVCAYNRLSYVLICLYGCCASCVMLVRVCVCGLACVALVYCCYACAVFRFELSCAYVACTVCVVVALLALLICIA